MGGEQSNICWGNNASTDRRSVRPAKRVALLHDANKTSGHADADSHELLSELPKEWSAEDVSAFVCGRRDWPFLASTYLCLWKAVVDALGEDYSRCFDALPTLHEGADSFHSAHRFAPHPYVVVQSAGLLDDKPAGKRIKR